MDQPKRPFWREKGLDEMSPQEWESLCDGCGRCCLLKLQDEENERIYYTDVACRLLDHGTCRCSDYPGRAAKVPDCLQLTPKTVEEIGWLPPTCGYRLVAEGRDLYWWHHLVSGDRDTVHAAGISVRGRTVSEDGMELDEFENHLVRWPGEVPKEMRRKNQK